MKVLVATYGFPSRLNNFYGANFVLNETKSLVKAGAEVVVVTPHFTDAPTIEKLNKNITIYRFRYFWPAKYQLLRQPEKPMYNKLSLAGYLQIPLAMIAFAAAIWRRSRNIDIIHSQWTLPVLSALPAKWLRHVPIIVTARGSDIRLLPKWLNRFIHRQVDAAADSYGPQKWNKDYKKDFPANYVKFPLIIRPSNPKKIDPKDREILSKRVFKIMYLGRFSRAKIKNGAPILTLVDAARILKNKKYSFLIYYIGYGEKDVVDEINKKISQYGLEKNIILLGSRNNACDYIPYCNLGVGGAVFNTVSQEFSYYGKAQLLSDTPLYFDKPWQDKINALKYTCNDPGSLAETIEYAISHKKQLMNISRNAQKIIIKYVIDEKSAGKIFIKQYKKIIAGSKRLA